MDKSKHMVSIPVEDYEKLLKGIASNYDSILRLNEQASAWSVTRYPKASSTLSISTAVPDWFDLGELHVYQKDSSKLMKRYTLVEQTDECYHSPEIRYNHPERVARKS